MRMQGQIPSRDWLNKHNAAILARKIQRYWILRGGVVNTSVEIIPGAEDRPMYAIRSDMIGGLPRG